MSKYLTEEQLRSNLKLGKSVEQWLGYEAKDTYTLLKWLRIDCEKGSTYSVSYFESFDDGNEDFLDVYEFAPLDPDVPYGTISAFSSFDDALVFAEQNYTASVQRFVPAGNIQDEYQEYLGL